MSGTRKVVKHFVYVNLISLSTYRKKVHTCNYYIDRWKLTSTGYETKRQTSKARWTWYFVSSCTKGLKCVLTVIHACYQWYLYSSKRKTSQQPDRTMLHLLYVASASCVCYKYAKSRTIACSIGIRYLATSLHTRIHCSVVCHASDFHSKLVFQQDSSTTLQRTILCSSVDVFFSYK